MIARAKIRRFLRKVKELSAIDVIKAQGSRNKVQG